jgi:hypothetical protein
VFAAPDAVLVNKTDVRVNVSFRLIRPRAVPPLVDDPNVSRVFDRDVFDLDPGDSQPLDFLPGGCVKEAPIFVASLPDRPLRRKVRMGNEWCVKKEKAPKWIIEYVP